MLRAAAGRWPVEDHCCRLREFHKRNALATLAGHAAVSQHTLWPENLTTVDGKDKGLLNKKHNLITCLNADTANIHP